MPNDRYLSYLKSDHWKNLRLEKLAKCGAICHFCRKEDISNDVHHVKYPSNLKHTKLKHLRVLCRGCHDLCHRVLSEFPGIKKQKSSRHIWRATEYHVRIALGQKPAQFLVDPEFRNTFIKHHVRISGLLRQARHYATTKLKYTVSRRRCPFSDELVICEQTHPSCSPEELLIAASQIAKTGLTMREITKTGRVEAWKQWKQIQRRSLKFPERGIILPPQPKTWKELHPDLL